ncbi:MAG: 16S rRNA (guanine(966)-N(2))-methyltransferase RsmD [Clostridia bacterium]
MRVITGSARGRNLITLSGLDTRPTTDRIKETIFNIIQFELQGRRVLDVFGGCGQMAIEAVSRGAKSAVIVDNSPEAIGVINENVAACGFQSEIDVIAADAVTYLQHFGRKFDVIFLDPPYDSDLLQLAISTIAQIDILSYGGIIVCESRKDLLLPETEAPYTRDRSYIYGKTRVTIYRKG